MYVATLISFAIPVGTLALTWSDSGAWLQELLARTVHASPHVAENISLVITGTAALLYVILPMVVGFILVPYLLDVAENVAAAVKRNRRIA